ARALEHVAHVDELVFERAREVGVAGPYAGDPLDLGFDGLDRHLVCPVDPVTILDPERDRGAKRAPVADARGDLSAVLLDLHAATAAIAALTARKVGSDVRLGEGQAGGQALDDHGEALAVALPGGEDAERTHLAVWLLSC